jgi:hypothetical protein
MKKKGLLVEKQRQKIDNRILGPASFMTDAFIKSLKIKATPVYIYRAIDRQTATETD